VPPPPPPPLPSSVGSPPSSSAAASPLALGGFEGEIALLAKGKEKPFAFKVLVKGTKLRFDLPEDLQGATPFGKLYVVMNAPAKQLFAVVDAKRQVISINLETMGDQMKSLRGAGAPAEHAPKVPPPSITKTGHHDTVAGRDCEDWEIKSDKGETVRICVANEGASWLQLPSVGLPAEHAWAAGLADGQHLPLRAITLDARGKETGRLEITKLEKKAVPDASFEMPAGYATVDIAGAMQGLMAGMLQAPAGLDDSSDRAGKAPPNVQEIIKKMQERAQKKQAKKAK